MDEGRRECVSVAVNGKAFAEMKERKKEKKHSKHKKECAAEAATFLSVYIRGYIL